jgi:hypothetical protein
MAAEFEEIVVTANALYSKQIGPDPRQTLFGLAGRRLVVAGGESLSLRRRKRLPVELAVGGQRQRLEPNIGRRDHVFGQGRRNMGAQTLGSGRDCIRPRDDIRHEPLLSRRVLTRQDDSFANARMLGESRLDLAELDPETTELHLKIVASEKLDRAVGPIAAEVPSPI